MYPSLKAVISIGVVWLNDIANSTRDYDILPLVRMAENAPAGSDIPMKVPYPVRIIVATKTDDQTLTVKTVSCVAELVCCRAVWRQP